MVLLTIDELMDEKKQDIGNIVEKEVYSLRGEKEIPYQDIEIIITYGLEEDWCLLDLDKMPNLRWIQVFQTGIEQIPIEEIEKRNIKLTNVRGIYGTPIAEYVMSLVLYEVRDIGRFIKNKKMKNYDRSELVDELGEKNRNFWNWSNWKRSCKKSTSI